MYTSSYGYCVIFLGSLKKNLIVFVFANKSNVSACILPLIYMYNGNESFYTLHNKLNDAIIMFLTCVSVCSSVSD